MDEMELEEFLAIWQGISRQDLTVICECSEATVNHWFSKGSSHREPAVHHKRRLAEAHRAFSGMQLASPRLLRIYNKLYGHNP
ncbi:MULTISPECIES: hypothetical protein [unclassified Coleofasciculus]|uniref:hypothetical protein n=1 Tax=unclassified Coleofasciculus TaxID=2692782 RepID=UPI0018814454|nr:MULTISPECIES: hypothetical protein [unclassified Coleofasciculus]MBE9128595.1 hypothetical protein [Coleofasciculus sp. LEGE 07081]MBE9150685.1 hypothetical protein [Coleofasciculus sp. LEGE 07092]